MAGKFDKEAKRRLDDMEAAVKYIKKPGIYKAVWGDETTEPDENFIAVWREPEEVKNGSEKTGKGGEDTGEAGGSS